LKAATVLLLLKEQVPLLLFVYGHPM